MFAKLKIHVLSQEACSGHASAGQPHLESLGMQCQTKQGGQTDMPVSFEPMFTMNISSPLQAWSLSFAEAGVEVS